MPNDTNEQVPVHVAIVMDGNGRWAQQKGLPRLSGHRAGVANIRRVVEAFAKRGVKYLTLYAFSTENWRRPQPEVRGLMRLLSQAVARETNALHKAGVRLNHVGKLEGIPERQQREVQKALEQTKNNTGLVLSIAFNYGGRDEIVQAARRILQDGEAPERLDEALFSRYLYTADLPDPDLVIRTAGEMRLSNFLIWQAAYSEYYATPVFWPDFDEGEVARALAAYSQRQRRFGGLDAS